MLVRCVACKNELKAQDADAGKIVKCPACGQKLRLPGVADASASADVDAPFLPAPSRSSDFVKNQPEYSAYGGTATQEKKPKRTCPACGEPVSRRDEFCPHCDEELEFDQPPKKEKERPVYDEEWMRTASSHLELDDIIISILLPFLILTCWWIPLLLGWDKGPKAKKMMYVSAAACVFYLILYLIIKAFQ